MEKELVVKVEEFKGKNVVSSRSIAEGLGKRHDNIIRDLEVILQNSNMRTLIKPSTYSVDGQNRKYKQYLLTKDGFTLYMFNIQGHNDFKLAYIQRFNAMEKDLSERSLPKTYGEALILAGKLELEKEKLELENKKKQEVIERKTDLIDNMTEDLDEVRIRKIVTDYVTKYANNNKLGYKMVYDDLYGFFGRAIETDIAYAFDKYIEKSKQDVDENKKYNKINKLKGVDRKMPCKYVKLSKVSFIVGIMAKGGELIECMAKFFEVPVENILDKYRELETIKGDE